MKDLKNYPNEFLTHIEAAEILGVKESDIIKAINDKELPAKLVGDIYFIRVSSIRKFLRECNVGVRYEDE